MRFWPDDSWDLIMGESRMTDQGLKYPLSGITPGFDNLFNGYVWRMQVHEGWLYASTMSWASLLPYLPTSAWPPDIAAVLRRWSPDRLAETGGFRSEERRVGEGWVRKGWSRWAPDPNKKK